MRIYGSRVVALVGGVTEHSGFFYEDTATMIVFPQGAVVRLSSSVAPGDVLTLTNLMTDREAVCRVVNVKPSANSKAYVEVGFTRPAPGFWGIDFPWQAPKPSSRPVTPAVTPERNLKQQPVESPSSVSAATPISLSKALVSPPASAKETPVGSFPSEVFKPASVSVIPAPVAETKGREKAVESASSALTAGPVSGRTAPVAAPNVLKPSSKPVIPLTIVEPKGKAQPVEPSSSAAEPTPLSAGKASVTVPPFTEDVSDVNSPSEVSTPPSGPLTLAAVVRPGEKEQALELASSIRTATAVSERGTPVSGPPSFDEAFETLEAPLHRQGIVEQVLPARQPRRKTILACSVSLLIVVGVAGMVYYRRHSRSVRETTVSSTPISNEGSLSTPSGIGPRLEGTTGLATSGTQPQPKADSAAQPGAQGQPSTSTAAGAPGEVKRPAEGPRPPVPTSKSAAPGASPQMPRGKLAAGKLSLRGAIPAKVAVPGEEPPPPAVGGELPGSVLGNQASSALGGIVPEASRGGFALPSKVQTPGGRVQPPRLLSSVLPVYPAAAKQARVEGDVTLQADIDTVGHVVRIKVVSGPLPLREAAMDALRRWKYEPSRLNDEPVPTQVLVVIKFRIK